MEAKDYRIICILEVYSQNKNEDDFLENLGLLSQVIREQEENEPKPINISPYVNQNAISHRVVPKQGPHKAQIKNAVMRKQVRPPNHNIRKQSS